MKTPILEGFGTGTLKWNDDITQEIRERIRAEVPKNYRAYAISFLAFRLLNHAGKIGKARFRAVFVTQPVVGHRGKL